MQLCKTDGTDLATGLEDEENTISTTFNPNPAKDFIVIGKDVRYKLFDIHGKGFILPSENIDDVSDRVVTKDLAKGIYFIKFEHSPAVRKLIIE